MSTWMSIFQVTAPIYLMIGAGYAAVRWGGVAPGDAGAIGRFAAQVCVPALLFRSLSTQHIDAWAHLDYVAVYAAGSLIALSGMTLTSWRLRRRPLSMAALQGLGSSSSNSAYIGYPIVHQLVGPVAAVALALNAVIENAIMIPTALAVADAGGGAARWREVAVATARGLMRNPVIWAIATGFSARAAGLQVPAAFDVTLGLAASAAPAVALFAVGAALVGPKLQGSGSDLLLVTCGKLFVHPLCVLAMVTAFPLATRELDRAAVLFAAMPMSTLFPILAQRYGHQRLCSAALLTATLASFATLSAFIARAPSA